MAGVLYQSSALISVANEQQRLHRLVSSARLDPGFERRTDPVSSHEQVPIMQHSLPEQEAAKKRDIECMQLTRNGNLSVV